MIRSPRQKIGEVCQFCRETCTARQPRPTISASKRQKDKKTLAPSAISASCDHYHHYCAYSTNVIFLQLRRVSSPPSASLDRHRHRPCRIAPQTHTRPEHQMFLLSIWGENENLKKKSESQKNENLKAFDESAVLLFPFPRCHQIPNSRLFVTRSSRNYEFL